MKYKVGDKVRVKKDLTDFHHIDPAVIQSLMGKECTVSTIKSVVFVGLSEDVYGFCWNIDMFESSDWFDALQTGDKVIYGSCKERTVLGKCGVMVFLSYENDPDAISAPYTKKMMEDYGYVPVDQTQVEEMTMEEVCEKLGKTIKIKK